MNSTQYTYILLLGSNLGNKQHYILRAIVSIKTEIGRIIRQTAVRETAPWGNTNQDTFLNMAVEVQTTLNPFELLDKIHQIEQGLGRRRIEKWGPRTIDIDILYCEDLVFITDTLKIPHPFLHERKFTLELLAELAPDFVHPVLQKSNRDLLRDFRE